MAENPPTASRAQVAAAVDSPIPICGMDELLQDVPLHSPRKIELLFSQPEYAYLDYPESIHVHCDHEKCNGVRRHEKHDRTTQGLGKNHSYHFVVYVCSNCTTSVKIFGLKVVTEGEGTRAGVCTKIYQEPTFGSPIPKRLFQVIGEANRDYYLQARRAIARGLGIGAYAYYRRMVENTKFALVHSVLEVAQATNASPAQIQLLKKAQTETQFSKAIEMLRGEGEIPAVLLIDGHNPLALLHDLLSEGIHQLSDAECLDRAQEAEIVLCEIADRMQVAMTERKAVKAAISNILRRKKEGDRC